MGGLERAPQAPRRSGRPSEAGAPLDTLTASERLLALLQLADGLFPAGGFAHSLGLETYVQAGIVRDAAGLDGVPRGPARRQRRAHRRGRGGVRARGSPPAGDLEACLDLDARLDAMRWVPELRAASVQMGRQTLRAAGATVVAPVLAAYARAVADDRAAGHHATVFGVVLGGQRVDPESAAVAYLHATAVLIVNAALRLLPLGQVEGQRVLAARAPPHRPARRPGGRGGRRRSVELHPRTRDRGTPPRRTSRRGCSARDSRDRSRSASVARSARARRRWPRRSAGGFAIRSTWR